MTILNTTKKDCHRNKCKFLVADNICSNLNECRDMNQFEHNFVRYLTVKEPSEKPIYDYEETKVIDFQEQLMLMNMTEEKFFDMIREKLKEIVRIHKYYLQRVKTVGYEIPTSIILHLYDTNKENKGVE